MKPSILGIFNKTISGVQVKIYLVLASVCVFGYWPVSFNLFTLKNDALRYFLPHRYNISNAIQNGEFPFWSPYLYMGFPVHGDMQSGAWNPIVWIISFFTRYNMSVLHFESLLYIFIAGVGMYKFIREFDINTRATFVIAVVYMFCGFITDSGQFIVWLACAAFIPFVLLYYYRILSNPTCLNSIKTAIAFYFLFVTGYPSLIIYCSYIMALMLIVKIISTLIENQGQNIKRILLMQAIFAGIFIGISLPAIISYAEMLPYYQRGTNISLQDALTNPFCLKCTTSFFIPFNLTREDIGFGTDPTMRNIYTGIITLIFFIAGISRKMNRLLFFVLALTFITFLFTLGDASPVREWSFRFVPLMSYFRHPSNMRIFTSIGILFIAAFGMHEYLENKNPVLPKKLALSGFIVAVTIFLIIVSYSYSTEWKTGIARLAEYPFAKGNLRNQLKEFIFTINFPATILLVGTIQIIFLMIFILFINKRSGKYVVPALAITNVLLIAQLSLSSTFVSKVSPEHINKFIGKYQPGFPIPDLQMSLAENTKEELLYDPTVEGYAGFYNKKIEILGDVINPCTLKDYGGFLESRTIRTIIQNYPVMYFSDSTVAYRDTGILTPTDEKKYLFIDNNKIRNKYAAKTNIEVEYMHSNSFKVLASSTDSAYFNVFQNYYKHWKAYIGEKEVPIILSNISFMSIILPPGTHEIQFRYEPTMVYISMAASLFTWIIVLLICTNSFKKLYGKQKR